MDIKKMQEKNNEINSIMEEVSFMNDIKDWLQAQSSIHIKGYGLGEADSEEEYFRLLNEISESYLTER